MFRLEGLYRIYFTYIFFTSGILIGVACVLITPVWYISRTVYRRLACGLTFAHWSQLVFLAYRYAGCDCAVHADPAVMKYPGNESAFVILNHKYDIDWVMGWICCTKFNVLRTSKVYAKSSLQYVPFFGWLWTVSEAIFVKRDWAHDRVALVESILRLMDYPLHFWILLFAEGTRFTEEKHKISNEFARKKGLPILKHHLYPRVKGFHVTLHALRQHALALKRVTAVYDCCVAMDDDIRERLEAAREEAELTNNNAAEAASSAPAAAESNGEATREFDVNENPTEPTTTQGDYTGHFPIELKASAPSSFLNTIDGRKGGCHGRLHVRRFEIKDIPCETEEDTAKWLYDVYHRKDEVFHEFVTNGTNEYKEIEMPMPSNTDVYNYVFWAVLCTLPLVYFMHWLVFVCTSFTIQLGFAAFIISLSVGLQVMAMVTEAKKGSAYGSTKKRK